MHAPESALNLVVFTHPNFLDSTSMPLFARMIVEGARQAGHAVQVWSPRACLHRLPAPRSAKKWLGYVDQYLLFPLQVRWRLRRQALDTLFVFSDQALGPWVPLVADRAHVIHCHDFLALRSALGEIPQNRTGWTGRLYQRVIRWGFRHGRHFISVSRHTQEELHRFLADTAAPQLSVVVHNGLNHAYAPLNQAEAAQRLRAAGADFPEGGFILHVGGNQWYKNRAGVLAIYAAYAASTPHPLPLLMVGAPPSASLQAAAACILAPGQVRFVVRPPVEVLEAAYSSASVLLFPSLAEGFGWPIIEAMACGCPVLTTNEAPMTEVGGPVADYLAPMPGTADTQAWAQVCAERLRLVLARSPEERAQKRALGIRHAQGFSAETAMQGYLAVYLQVMRQEQLS